MAVYMPGVGLCTVMTMVQLPNAGMNPMPKEYTPALTLPNVPQVLDPGGVAVRPAGMVMLPPPIKADAAPGLVSVSVIEALVLTATDVGAKATVMLGVATAAMVMVTICVPVPPPFVAVTVGLKVPAAVGVPVISPVPAATLRPAGKPAAPKLVGVFVAVI